MKVLVTGIGGDIGSAIGRILRGSPSVTRLIGCDIHDQHGGPLICEECCILPPADSANYLSRLAALAADRHIDAIVPAAEPELRRLCQSGLDRQLGGIPLIMANQRALEIGFDKLRTASFLEAHGLPFPWTRLVSAQEPRELPCIVKSRFGAGSKEVRRVEAPAHVSAHRTLSPDHIWQEYLGTAEQEYTCGVLRHAVTDEVRVMAFRRRLVGGLTGYGEVVDDAAIEQLCCAIARALDLDGSINVQLRMTERGPVVFEINPRFSSTVVFRHLLGFQDLMWSLAMQLHGVLPAYRDRPRAGTRILKKFDEVILG